MLYMVEVFLKPIPMIGMFWTLAQDDIVFGFLTNKPTFGFVTFVSFSVRPETAFADRLRQLLKCSFWNIGRQLWA